MLTSVEKTESNYSRLSDEELVERFRNGDRESLDALVRAYLPKTYKKVCRQVPESDAEDVRQEILLSFIESIGNLRISSNFAAWFRIIVSRRIADYYRQTSRQRGKFTGKPPPEAEDPWKKIDDELTIKEALVEIPENYKEVLLLKFSEGLSLSEISEKLGLTYEAARSRYRRGMDMLKGKMKEF